MSKYFISAKNGCIKYESYHKLVLGEAYLVNAKILDSESSLCIGSDGLVRDVFTDDAILWLPAFIILHTYELDSDEEALLLYEMKKMNTD